MLLTRAEVNFNFGQKPNLLSSVTVSRWTVLSS